MQLGVSEECNVPISSLHTASMHLNWLYHVQYSIVGEKQGHSEKWDCYVTELCLQLALLTRPL